MYVRYRVVWQGFLKVFMSIGFLHGFQEWFWKCWVQMNPPCTRRRLAISGIETYCTGRVHFEPTLYIGDISAPPGPILAHICPPRVHPGLRERRVGIGGAAMALWAPCALMAHLRQWSTKSRTADRYDRARPLARAHDMHGCCVGDQRVTRGAELVDIKNIFFIEIQSQKIFFINYLSICISTKTKK